MSRQTPLHIHWMTEAYMSHVLWIESAVFEFPWQRADFARCRRTSNCVAMVAEGRDGQVVGYMIYEVVRHANPRTELRRSSGLPSPGRSPATWLHCLTKKLTTQRRSWVSLAVCESNLPAQQFWRACGFRATRTPPQLLRRNTGGRLRLPVQRRLAARPSQSLRRRAAASNLPLQKETTQ